MKILVAYASAHGSTAEVAAFIKRVLNVYNAEVEVTHADQVTSVAGYDAFVLGSPIHSSLWLPSLSQFMFRFEQDLQNHPVYMWINCLVVLEDGGYQTAMDNYLWQEALGRLDVKAEQVGIFAGKLDWERISGDEKWLLSANYEGKELPGNKRGDYRNWKLIAGWAHEVAQDMMIRLDFSAVHADDAAVKEETITEEDVNKLAWPDNPADTI